MFTEDDIVFCGDTLNYYNNYRDKKINCDENCIGITSSSLNFYPLNNDIFKNINSNEIKDDYKDKINDIIKFVNDNNLLNVLEPIKTAPNKQMGLFKEGWG